MRCILRNRGMHECLPSHEGSGLKSFPVVLFADVTGLPSHEGSGLKLFMAKLKRSQRECLPSHEGSGLKCARHDLLRQVDAVSPRMRGVD